MSPPDRPQLVNQRPTTSSAVRRTDICHSRRRCGLKPPPPSAFHTDQRQISLFIAARCRCSSRY